IVFARWSAMILALPITTAFGVVSTAWVCSSSEMLSVPPPPAAPYPVVEVDVVAATPAPAAVAGGVRRGGVGLAPGAGDAPSAPGWAAAPGSVNAWTMTGKTSAAEI